MPTSEKSAFKPEHFVREPLTPEDIEQCLREVATKTPLHLTVYGDGIFCHPQEIVGCMFGQQMKLSRAADDSIYTGDLTKFRERCRKTLMAMVIGIASVDKLIELRAKKQ